MGTAARIVGGLVFVLFVSVIAVRPLVANPAIAGVLQDGFDGWQLLAVFPLVLVTLLVVALRVRSLTDDTPGDDDRDSVASTDNRETFWEARKAGETPADDGSLDEGGTGADTAALGDGNVAVSGDSQGTEEPGTRPPLLGGQGGPRDRESGIEEEPPDAMLSEHLDHLQAELDGQAEMAQDLQTLAAVAEEVEGDRTVPARCPQAHCDAVWTGRTVLGIGTDRYEVLEDGTRVQCLQCEEIHTLE